jgi:hypothetical protein
MGLTFKLGTAPQVTTNYIPKSNSNSFSNSLLYDNGTSVAIGTTAPDAGAPFTIDKTGAGLQTLAYFQNQQAAAADTGTSIYFLGTSGLNSLGRFVSAWEGSSISSSYMAFWTRGGGTTSEKLRISSGGNVGINNSNPAYYLDVSGNAKFGSNSINGDTIIQSNSTPLQIRGRSTYDRPFLHISWDVSPDSGVLIADTLRFNTGATLGTNSGTERMRITSAGNVGIAGTAGSGRLQVWGEDQSGSNFAFNTYNSGGFGLFFVRNDGNIRTNAGVYGNTTSGTTRTLYVGSGDYYLGGIASIRKSKKNIENVSNVDWLYQLNPVTFNYRKKDEDGNYTDETYEDLNYGLIAEDTAPIADFLINYNDKEDGTKEMVGIEYSRLITPLLKAIQELNAKVSALENR